MTWGDSINNKEDEKDLLGDMQYNYRNFPWKPIVIYVFVGFLWIMFSDRLLGALVHNYRLYRDIQSYKGVLYVLVTAVLLFFLIKLDYANIINLTKAIVSKNQDLVSFSEELIASEEELSQKIEHLNKTMDYLNAEKQFTDEIFNCSNTAIMVWNLQGEVIEINDHFYDLFGYDDREIIGKKWFDLIIPKEEREIVSKLINELKNNNNVKNFENKVITKRGEILDMMWNDSVIQNPKSKELVIVSYGIDITLEKRNERKAFELAFKDRLTGFNNRVVLEQDIETLIEKNQSFTMYYIDIDNFRNLNDIHGHQYGDLFLKEFSTRIRVKLNNCTFYCWCGDEFMVLEKDEEQSLYDERVKQIFEISKEKWHYEHIEYRPSVSIGIVKYPQDGESREDLLKNIDIALHHSKSLGKSNASKYCQSFQQKIETRLSIENAIHKALIGNGFELHYQPIYSLITQEMTSIEVLLRWRGSAHSISTGDFIALAEETEQIIEIDHWVIENAFEFIACYLKKSVISVSINLSAKTISSSETIVFLKDCLDKYDVDATKIEFEITEHSLINNIEQSLVLVNALKSLGFKLSLDDFGTRYSSLNYLSNMPFDSLKIDKSYVDKIVSFNNDLIIVDQIIQLGKRLGLKIIAEGIEEVAQLDILTELGCDYGQGYYLSKPIEEAKIISMISM